MIPLGINGGDQDSSKVVELMKLMLKFNGVLPGTVEKKNEKKKQLFKNVQSYCLPLLPLQH